MIGLLIHKMTARFGCLDGETLELEPGLNLILAPNEGGKSTWCAFLRAMLYGIDTRSREKKNEPAEKHRYQPWNGGPMEGLLECTHEGERILLRRSAHGTTPMGDFSAVYAESGLPVPGLTGANVGERLTGTGREVFERSVFIRQTHLAIEESQQLEARIAALVSSGGGERSFSQAQESLKQQQRQRRYHKNGALPQVEEEIRQTRARLTQMSGLRQQEMILREETEAHRAAFLALQEKEAEASRQHEEEAQTRFAEAAAELDAARLRLETMVNEEQNLEETALAELEEEISLRERDIRQRGRSLFLFCLLATALSLSFMATTFAVHMEDVKPAVLAAALALAGAAMLAGAILRFRLDRRDEREIDLLTEEAESRQTQLAYWELEWDVARERERTAKQALEIAVYQKEPLPRSGELLERERTLSQLEQRLALLQGRLQEQGDPLLLEEALQEQKERHARLSREYEALEIAKNALEEAERSLRARFSPALNEQAGRYFALMTVGAYGKLTLERDLSALAEPASSLALRDARLLSQGTLDQLYLSVRLAIGDLLLPAPEPCPLILDDALMSFDEERCQAALRLFRFVAERRQVILFSSQRREGVLLAGDAAVRQIRL